MHFQSFYCIGSIFSQPLYPLYSSWHNTSNALMSFSFCIVTFIPFFKYLGFFLLMMSISIITPKVGLFLRVFHYIIACYYICFSYHISLLYKVCHLKVPVNLSHFSRHDLAYFKARYSIFWYMSHVSIQSFSIGCAFPVGIQIKIQIGQISELNSNLNIWGHSSYIGCWFTLHNITCIFSWQVTPCLWRTIQLIQLCFKEHFIQLGKYCIQPPEYIFLCPNVFAALANSSSVNTCIACQGLIWVIVPLLQNGQTL